MGNLDKVVLLLGTTVLGLGTYYFFRFYFNKEILEAVAIVTGIAGFLLTVFEFFRKK